MLGLIGWLLSGETLGTVVRRYGLIGSHLGWLTTPVYGLRTTSNMEPMSGIGPLTSALRKHCSTS